MSEYQRYEFMTIDRPLTRAQLDEVNELSSHIEASPTHAFIEYHWGDFKHDPIKVLYEYFDGFLYETREFQERFRNWVQSYRRRPGLMERLRRHQFVVP